MGAGVSVDSVTKSAPTGTLSDETKAALAALTPEARAEIETLLALQTATTADGKAIAMKLAPARYDLLKDLFKKIDIDGDGNITRAEYAERVKHPTLAKAFDFMDGEQAGGNADGQIQLEEWVNIMGQLGATYDDEAFTKEFSTLLTLPEAPAAAPAAEPAAEAPAATE